MADQAGVLAAMMADLGDLRLEEFARDDGFRGRGRPFMPPNHIPTLSTRPATTTGDPQNQWQQMYSNAVSAGMVDDDDARGVRNLDSIADGNLARLNRHAAREARGGHQSGPSRPAPMPTATGTAGNPAEFLKMNRLLRGTAYDPVNPNNRRGGGGRSRFANAPSSAGLQVSQLGGLVPPGATVRRYIPGQGFNITTGPAPPVPSSNTRPGPTTASRNIPTGPRTTTVPAEIPPHRRGSTQAARTGNPSASTTLNTQDRSSNPLLPHMQKATSATVPAGVKTQDAVSPHLRKAASSAAEGAEKKGNILSPLKATHLGTPASGPGSGSADNHSAEPAETPPAGYHFDAKVEMPLIDENTDMNWIPGRMSLYESADMGTVVWELRMANGSLHKEDIRVLMDPFRTGSNLLVRRQDGEGKKVRTSNVRFENLDLSKKFIDTVDYLKTRFAASTAPIFGSSPEPSTKQFVVEQAPASPRVAAHPNLYVPTGPSSSVSKPEKPTASTTPMFGSSPEPSTKPIVVEQAPVSPSVATRPTLSVPLAPSSPESKPEKPAVSPAPTSSTQDAPLVSSVRNTAGISAGPRETVPSKSTFPEMLIDTDDTKWDEASQINEKASSSYHADLAGLMDPVSGDATTPVPVKESSQAAPTAETYHDDLMSFPTSTPPEAAVTPVADEKSTQATGAVKPELTASSHDDDSPSLDDQHVHTMTETMQAICHVPTIEAIAAGVDLSERTMAILAELGPEDYDEIYTSAKNMSMIFGMGSSEQTDDKGSTLYICLIHLCRSKAFSTLKVGEMKKALAVVFSNLRQLQTRARITYSEQRLEDLKRYAHKASIPEWLEDLVALGMKLRGPSSSKTPETPYSLEKVVARTTANEEWLYGSPATPRQASSPTGWATLDRLHESLKQEVQGLSPSDSPSPNPSPTDLPSQAAPLTERPHESPLVRDPRVNLGQRGLGGSRYGSSSSQQTTSASTPVLEAPSLRQMNTVRGQDADTPEPTRQPPGLRSVNESHLGQRGLGGSRYAQ